MVGGGWEGLSVSSLSLSSHAPLCAQAEDSAQRSGPSAGVARQGATVISTHCPCVSCRASWTANQVRLSLSALCPLSAPPPPLASHPAFLLASPSSTFVKRLPHPSGPEAGRSLIWSPESPETRRAPSGPGCAPLGSDPSRPELWRRR